MVALPAASLPTCIPSGALLILGYQTSTRAQISAERPARIARMAKKKLTAAERLVDEQMLAILEWASDNPIKWHPVGKLEAT
jgi:hypothetical protein